MRIRYLMRKALEREASDLHLVAGIPPSIRVDGEIEFLEGGVLSGEDTQAIIAELLSAPQLERFNAERELEFSYQEESLGRFRASVYFERGFVEASFRLVPLKVRSLEDLNLPPVLREMAMRPSGLVLITGPTGVGKTTTMNAMIHLINQERRARVITVEDPIEFVHSHGRSIIIQREVESDTLSFHRALVSALRQDPNVLCVGEMRDLETMATALTAAETGHLVISTLHTQSAALTVERIIDVFPSHQQQQIRMQLSNTLQAVVCQQLLPRVAEKGRVLAYEVMVATPAIRALIRDAKVQQIPNVISTSREEGMILMDRCIRSLYEQGLVSYDVAMSRCQDPETFRSMATRRG